MTLSAIRKDGTLLNPSLMIAEGVDRLDAVEIAKDAQSDKDLFCPHCYHKLGKLYEVRFRNAEARRVHFFHPKYEGEESECKNYSNESEKHLSAKKAIELRLNAQGLGEVGLEVRMQVSFELAKHRKPDIVVTYPNGAIEAHEVQISAISLEDLQARTEDLKRIGGVVVWYLHGKAYNTTNREWLHQHGIKCFRLWFEEGEADAPRWEVAPPIQKRGKSTPQSDGSGYDQCGEYSAPKAKRKKKNYVTEDWFPAVGDKVHKRYNDGWTGLITAIMGDRAEVIWIPDTYPTMEKICDLRPDGCDREYRSEDKEERGEYFRGKGRKAA